MDLAYLPDSISFTSRFWFSNSNDEYTNTWVDINENRHPGKPRKDSCQKEQKKCTICKNRQKRALNNYIMNRTRKESERDNAIQEEEEENDEESEQKEVEKNKTNVKNTVD